MEEIKLIEKKIKKIPRQKIFSAESICRDFSIKSAKHVLNQLKKMKEIGVISHDLYFRPGKSRYLPGQPISPGADKIIKAVSKKTGEIISVHPVVALNQIGLSTQVPVRVIYYTTGRSRYIKVNGENSIKLVHVNPRKIVMPNTVTCHVVTALWYEGKKYLKPRIVKKLHTRLKDKYFNEVLMHLDKMPAWMRKVFIRYQSLHPNDPELQEDPDEYWQGWKKFNATLHILGKRDEKYKIDECVLWGGGDLMIRVVVWLIAIFLFYSVFDTPTCTPKNLVLENQLNPRPNAYFSRSQFANELWRLFIKFQPVTGCHRLMLPANSPEFEGIKDVEFDTFKIDSLNIKMLWFQKVNWVISEQVPKLHVFKTPNMDNFTIPDSKNGVSLVDDKLTRNPR